MSYQRREVMSYDPVARKKKIFHEIDRGNEWAVETVVDVGPLIECNKAEYAATDERARWGRVGEVWAKVGSIDPVVYFDLVKKGIVDPNDNESLLRWLNDRDNLKWRTRPGNLV